MIENVIAESERRIAALTPATADDIRHAHAPVVGFSTEMVAADRAIKEFLFPRMYRHTRIERVMNEAQGVVRDLFAHYTAHPSDMPAEWARDLEGLDAAARARQVADFIAGMTDRYALIEHTRYFDSTPELR
jgi:dGTPase